MLKSIIRCDVNSLPKIQSNWLLDTAIHFTTKNIKFEIVIVKYSHRVNIWPRTGNDIQLCRNFAFIPNNLNLILPKIESTLDFIPGQNHSFCGHNL